MIERAAAFAWMPRLLVLAWFTLGGNVTGAAVPQPSGIARTLAAVLAAIAGGSRLGRGLPHYE